MNIEITPKKTEGAERLLQVSVPVSGHASDRLVFRVVSRSPSVVFIEEAWLSLHSWPLS